MFFLLLSELEVDVRGTAETDTVCRCSETAGYFLEHSSVQYGRTPINKGDCRFKPTTQIGLCLVCFIVLLRLSKPVPKPRFFAKPNRTETAVLCLCIDGSVLKWSSSGVLNVKSRLQPASRLAHSSRRRVLSLGSKVRSPAALHP